MSRVWKETTPNSRTKAWKSEKYKSYIKSLDCCATGQKAEVAHYITGVGVGGITDETKDDSMVIPLTIEMSESLKKDVKQWEQKHMPQLVYLARTIQQAVRDSQLTPFERWSDGLG